MSDQHQTEKAQAALSCNHFYMWHSPAGTSHGAHLCMDCGQPDPKWLNEIHARHAPGDGDDLLERFTNALDCCGTCAGGVLASRIREAASQAWEDCAKESHALGWLHDWALSDLLARNPYRLSTPPAYTCMDCGHRGPSQDGDCDRCGGPAMPSGNSTPPGQGA